MRRFGDISCRASAIIQTSGTHETKIYDIRMNIKFVVLRYYGFNAIRNTHNI